LFDRGANIICSRSFFKIALRERAKLADKQKTSQNDKPAVA